MIFGLQFHWGTPWHRTEMRSWTGSLGFRNPPAEKSNVQHCYVSHEIVRWYGISYRRAWFFGFSRFGVSRDQRSSELPIYTTSEERKTWANYDNWPLAEDDDNDDQSRR